MQPKTIHIIGIGGSGISALAYYYYQKGVKVSGSDMSENSTTTRLKADGLQIFVGHEAKNLPSEADEVIYSEAIDKSKNPEYIEAQKKKIPTKSYFQALGELSQHKKTIVITGTHGKTTTTAMLGQALIEMGADPTVIVGSKVPFFDNRNIHIGHSEWLIVEGCEYRRSFLNLNPFGVIILNCEWEHVDYYKTEADYVKAFQELVNKIPSNGFLVYNATDPNCQKLNPQGRVRAVKSPPPSLGGVGGGPGEEQRKVWTAFNLLNATHALEAALQMGFAEEKIIESLGHFQGTARRMEVKGEKNGIMVIDDYAHHPTEIKATLAGLKENYKNKRVICVFQPHQYSRTLELLEDFKAAFKDADIVIIPNIFEARDTEEDKKRISAEILAQQIPHATWGESFEKTLQILQKTLQKGDLLVTMGAGNIDQLATLFLNSL